MGGAAGHGEITERSPDFVPGHFTIGPVFQTSGAHGDGLNVFVAVLVLRRQDGLDSGFKGFHRLLGGPERGGGADPFLAFILVYSHHRSSAHADEKADGFLADKHDAELGFGGAGRRFKERVEIAAFLQDPLASLGRRNGFDFGFGGADADT